MIITDMAADTAQSCQALRFYTQQQLGGGQSAVGLDSSTAAVTTTRGRPVGSRP